MTTRFPKRQAPSRNGTSFCSAVSAILLLSMISTDAFVAPSNQHYKHHATSTSTTTSTSLFYTSTNHTTDAAQQLLDKAAQLRAEIAAMEGKTVEQVTQEAQQKKVEETKRKEQQELENEARMEARKNSQTEPDRGRSFVQLPNTVDDMIRQASRAVERAYQDGKTRQTVRFHLVEALDENVDVTEESQWPGGAQQMYREAGKPMTSALLKELQIAPPSDTNNKQDWMAPKKIVEQDIWDFDGSALHTAEAAAGPKGDIQALVFPNTDVKYIKDIDEISTSMGQDRLFLLVNPFWRNLDSWSFNLLAPNAKAKAQKVIFTEDANTNYQETYVNMVFQVRGEKCIAIKAYPYDWQIFAMREDDYYPNAEFAIRLGSCKDEPTSSVVTKWLNERPEFKETKTMRQFKKL